MCEYHKKYAKVAAKTDLNIENLRNSKALIKQQLSVEHIAAFLVRITAFFVRITAFAVSPDISPHIFCPMSPSTNLAPEVFELIHLLQQKTR